MNQLAYHGLNWADYVIIFIILFSTIISLMRGFLAEAISLLTWIVAAVIGFKLALPIANLLSNLVHAPSLRLIIGFLAVFIVILIIGSLVNHFLGVFVRTNGLSGTNRLLGIIFGFARAIILIAIFLLFAKTTSVVKENWWQTSQLIPYFHGIISWLQQFIPLHFNSMSHYFSNPKLGNS
jgi:membrane protein required for colicin V production